MQTVRARLYAFNPAGDDGGPAGAWVPVTTTGEGDVVDAPLGGDSGRFRMYAYNTDAEEWQPVEIGAGGGGGGTAGTSKHVNFDDEDWPATEDVPWAQGDGNPVLWTSSSFYEHVAVDTQATELQFVAFNLNLVADADGSAGAGTIQVHIAAWVDLALGGGGYIVNSSLGARFAVSGVVGGEPFFGFLGNDPGGSPNQYFFLYSMAGSQITDQIISGDELNISGAAIFEVD